MKGYSLAALKRDISILDVATDLGYQVVRKGRYYSLKEHDSVIMDPYKNCFWQNSVPGEKRSIGRGGSIIDFVAIFTGATIKEAIKHLENTYTLQDISPSPIQSNKTIMSNELRLPSKAENNKRVFAYLCKTRGIEAEVVEDLVRRKQIYQDIKGNCVFVSYENGVANYGMFRGTNTYQRFMGDCPGNDYRSGFFIDNGGKHLLIAESVIDGMSLMSMMKMHGRDYKEYDYLILGGVGKLEALEYRMMDKNYTSTIIALDNDEAGRSAGEMIKNRIESMGYSVLIRDFYPTAKDWNLELLEKKQAQTQEHQVDLR